MNEKIKERVLKNCELFLGDKSTVREVAKKSGCSKSTVHKDLVERLILLDMQKYLQVKSLLEYNKSIRHIRGGESTKKKFKPKKIID